MIKCPNCEGEMKFDAKLQKVKCEYCGSVFEPGKITDKVEVSEEDINSYEGKAYRCSQCGAELLTFDDTAITFCSYCGSQAMIEDKMIKHNNPDFIIPFKKTKEECVEAYKNRVSKFFFAPNYMKSDLVVEKFRGIFMPYGIFNLSKKGIVENTGSIFSHRRGDYVYYDDYKIEADVDANYDGVSFDLVSKFYDNYSTSIPFNYNEAVPFNSDYMIGYYADSFDVEPEVYKKEAEKIVKPNAIKKLIKNPEFRKYGCILPKIDFDANSKLGMFPTYFLAMRDKQNKNVNYAVINGQTGQVAADLPIDFKKYIVVSLILAIIIFLIINSALVIAPTIVSVFSVIASIISLIISRKQFKKIVVKEIKQDDKGVLSKTKNKPNIKYNSVFTKIIISCLIHLCFSFITFLGWAASGIIDILEKSPLTVFGTFIAAEIFVNVLITYIRIKKKKKKSEELVKLYGQEEVTNYKKVEKGIRKKEVRFLIKEILAFIISIIPILTNPINDVMYYIPAIISLILIVMSFYDLVKEHNMLVSNKLPQLEKRGGDENE